jgi:hypothetical protein
VMNASLDPTAGRQSDVKTTLVSAVHVKKDIRKGSDWFMVHINAHERGCANWTIDQE